MGSLTESLANTECRLVIAFFKDIERWRVPQDFSRLDLRETEVVKTYETFSNHAKRIVEDCMDNRVAPLAGWSPYGESTFSDLICSMSLILDSSLNRDQRSHRTLLHNLEFAVHDAFDYDRTG